MEFDPTSALVTTVAIALLGLGMALNGSVALGVGRVFRLGVPLPPSAAPVYRAVGGLLAGIAVGILLVYSLKRALLHP